MRKTAVCQLTLGRTRIAGYTLYDHDTMAFEETTPRDVKALIKEGVVNGLKLDKDNEIMLDEVGFNCHNMLAKSGVGNYRPLKPATGVAAYEMYAMTKAVDTDEGMIYEVVSSKCARLPIKEEKIRSLFELGCLTGCWINKETGMIRLADGVEMIDMTTDNQKGTTAEGLVQAEAEAVKIPEKDEYKQISEMLAEAVKDETAAPSPTTEETNGEDNNDGSTAQNETSEDKVEPAAEAAEQEQEQEQVNESENPFDVFDKLDEGDLNQNNSSKNRSNKKGRNKHK